MKIEKIRKSTVNNMFKLYKMTTDELDDPEIFQNHYQELSEQRRQKIDEFHLQKDRKLSLGAGILMDRGLKEYGLRESKVKMGAGENGKPFLLNYPEIHFNLSHSGNMVLAVFSDTEVGCDIEYMNAVNLKLARRFFCQSEYDSIINQNDSQEQKVLFYRLWTLKESFMKVTGLGMKLPLNEFCFQFGDIVTIQQKIDAARYSFEEYQFGEYRAAVCCRIE